MKKGATKRSRRYKKMGSIGKITGTVCRLTYNDGIKRQSLNNIGKVLELDDVFERGKHKGEKVVDVIHSDWKWMKCANEESNFFFFDIDDVISEHFKDVLILCAEGSFPFGKYQGKTIKEVAEENPNYLRWVNENRNQL